MLLLFELGCWSSPVAVPAESQPKPPVERAGEAAERMLRSDAPFDLAYPAQTPPRREATTRELLNACRAEYHPSCWLLLHVATTEHALEVGLADVVSQCRKRDLSSCQAIPPLSPHPLLPAGLPGERGRILYQKSRAPSDEEAEQLRVECRDGFAYSCKVLAQRSSDPEERREMLEKTSVAARAGCRRKIPDACALVDSAWPVEERLGALDWNCQVWRSECNRLGAALLALGRLDEARSAYERACQYGRQPELCIELAELYLDGKLPEPIRGRATTLVNVACAALETYDGADDYPACSSSP